MSNKLKRSALHEGIKGFAKTNNKTKSKRRQATPLGTPQGRHLANAPEHMPCKCGRCGNKDLVKG